MKNYIRNYVGKGTQVQNLDIVKCHVKMEELMKFVREYQGADYVTFEVAKMQKEDKYGKTHTVYCTTIEDAVEEKPAPKPAAGKGKGKGKGKPVTADQDLPF